MKLLTALLDVLEPRYHEISAEKNDRTRKQLICEILAVEAAKWNTSHSFWLSPAWLLGWKSLTMIPSCRIFSINFSRCSSRLSNFSAIVINRYQTTKMSHKMPPLKLLSLLDNLCLLLATTLQHPQRWSALRLYFSQSLRLLLRYLGNNQWQTVV